jgi:adenylate cyclase
MTSIPREPIVPVPKSKFAPTLHQVFMASMVALAALLVVQVWLLYSSGVLEPQHLDFKDLDSLHARLLLLAALIAACIVVGGWMSVRRIRHDLRCVIADAKRMQQFDFDPAPVTETIFIADVRAVRDSLEGGKLAIRAMRKYVPVALLRQLYAERKEAALGAVPMELSILFSDIRNFTSVSEKLTGAELARALGLYFDAMTDSIDRHQGTIDKFIGDSVMAFWNAPLPIEGDARLACLTALHSVRACKQLFASPSWGDLPRWETRYGIHRDKVMVGNFGAPARLNYTAMGDGVNTASRLEGLNKVYGTWIFVSEEVREAVGNVGAEFVFRKLDVVTVKGKTIPTAVFELIGVFPSPEYAIVYERAFELYLTFDFSGAMELLRPQLASDPPSNVLFNRCVAFQKQPPPADWDGVFTATIK